MSLEARYKIDFEIDGDHVLLSEAYKKIIYKKQKKITGSRLANVLGFGQYSTPFIEWMKMVGLFTEFIEPLIINAGNKIEPIVRDYVEKKLNQKFLSYQPQEHGWDLFPDNHIFGGIPDGEPVDQQNQLLYPAQPMLEIKTTSIDSYNWYFNGSEWRLVLVDNLPVIKVKDANLKKWFDNNQKPIIPIDYAFQLGLYMYLRDITKGLFAVAFLLPEDYLKPEQFVCEQHKIALINFDLDLHKMGIYINYAENWYQNHIQNLCSPKMSTADKKWLEKQLEINY